MRQYRDKLGTREGRAVLVKRSNILLVTDRAEALDRLRSYVDSEIVEAMGVPASEGHAPGEEPRPPSLGAIASRESIHFYLMAYARWSRITLAAREDKDVLAKHYPEADLWTDERGFRALENEYKRVNEFVQLARETGGQGWNEPNPDRTFSPVEQRRLTIRYGVVTQPAANKSAPKSKKTNAARKR